MSATEELRDLLYYVGHEYSTLGSDSTMIGGDELSMEACDTHMGTLTVRFTHPMSANDAYDTMVRNCRLTRVRSMCDEDGVGRSWCDRCGYSVGRWFRFCPWCGSRFDRDGEQS